MSKKRTATRNRAASPGASQSAIVGGLSGWDAANVSARRGYVYFPTLDTTREVPAWGRLEMLRRARYLVRNVGYAKRCTRGLALMVGYLSPRPFTGDAAWNRAAEAAFERRAGSANTFDRAGRFNCYSLQPLITQSRLTDGDFLTVLTESQSGGAMVANYESHQIGNALTSLDQSQWRDGMRVIGERAVQARILDPADAQKFTDVPAQDFILHADFLSVGHPRGQSALHCAINNMLDRTEIWSDLKLGIKVGNRIGYYISRQTATQKGPPGMGARPTAQQTGDGEEVLVENVFRGGKVMGLAPGEDIKTLLDQRPHPNAREFLEDLNRDCAWGVGLAPEVLWNIAQLGGASVRYVLAEAQTFLESQQQILVDQFLGRFWVYFIAKEIKAGRLARPSDPEWFWKCGWQPPAKLTVDIGRDGKLSIDLHRAGMLTLKRWYGSQGLFEEEEMRQHVREYALRIKLCEEVGKEFGMVLDPDKVFPPAPGSAAPADSAEEQDPAFSDPEPVTPVAA